MEMIKVFFIYLILINIITFIIYGIDKQKAKHHQWRISEFTLILFAVIGGSIGALAGMYCFRHKTKHLKFTVGIPCIIIIQGLIWMFIGGKL